LKAGEVGMADDSVIVAGMMRLWIWLAIAFVVPGGIVPSAAQELPVPPPPEQSAPAKPIAEPNGQITGMVICSDTHRPARGAMVMIGGLPGSDGGQREVMTRVGLDGRYTADHLGPGEYAVMAFFPGYLSPMAGVVSGPMNDSDPKKMRELLAKNGTVVVKGTETETFDVTLTRGAAISGRVLYADGSPAAQVVIDVEDTNAKSDPKVSPGDSIDVDALMRTMFTHQSLGTNDQGRFRITGLAAGTYRVSAVQSVGGSMGPEMGDGFGEMLGGVSDSGALHFYSGDTIHKTAAKKYELRSGDEVADIDITIPETLFHRVSGSVHAMNGEAIGMATLRLTDAADETLVFSSKLRQDGTFEFPTVPPGTYMLSSTEVKTFRVASPREKGAVDPPPLHYEDMKVAVIVKDGDVADVQMSLKERAATDEEKSAESQPPGLRK